MPLIETLRFGALEYDPSSLIEFPYGVPGFEDQRRFVLVEQAALAPFVFLQSIDTPALCFPTVPMGMLHPAYELEVTPEELETLNLPSSRQPAIGKDVLCLAIVAAENGTPTANLLAPVVINLSGQIGMQAVRHDARYSHCQRVESSREALCS